MKITSFFESSNDRTEATDDDTDYKPLIDDNQHD